MKIVNLGLDMKSMVITDADDKFIRHEASFNYLWVGKDKK